MKRESSAEKGVGWARLRAPWMIFWVGFGVRVALILIGHTYRVRTDQGNWSIGYEAGRIARSVATGHGYASPFNGVSGPTAWLPPLYPLLMAAAFKVFGVYTRGAALALLVVDSLFSAAVAPAVYEIAARCFDAKGIARRASKHAAPVAVWSAWLWAVYPAALQYAIHWIWEMSLTVCLFSWAIVVVLRLRGVGEAQRTGVREQGLGIRDWGLWLVLGVLWGLIALSNASLLLCLPAMIAWIAWPEMAGSMKQEAGSGKRGLLRIAGGAMLTMVVFAVVLAPWVMRNERVLHAFVPTRDNFGVELYESSLLSNDGLPWGTTMSMWEGDPVFQLYERMGEVRFARMRQAQAIANLRARPGLFVRWTLGRVFLFWDGLPHPENGRAVEEYLRHLSYAFLSACGLMGLGLMLWRRVEGAGLFALCFLLAPIPYYLVTVSTRFRHPLEPLIGILGVYLFRSAKKKTVDSRG